MLIVLKGPDGLRRVPEGVPYRKLPGEKVIGSERDETESELNDQLEKHEIPLGDFVERAFKLLPEAIRPTHCSACEKRKKVLNHIRSNGVLNTIKQIREIKE
jgi:hypothetical protein